MKKTFLYHTISFILGGICAFYLSSTYNDYKVKEHHYADAMESELNHEDDLRQAFDSIQTFDTISTLAYVSKNKEYFKPYQVSESYIPTEGFIPNEKVALQVALPILVAIYGNSILKQMPINIALSDSNTWLLTGTLKAHFGGVFYIEIDRTTGKILCVHHGK